MSPRGRRSTPATRPGGGQAAPRPRQHPDVGEGTGECARETGRRDQHDQDAGRSEGGGRRVVERVVQYAPGLFRHVERLGDLAAVLRARPHRDRDQDREHRGEELPGDRHRPVEQLDANAVGQAADDDPAGPSRGRPFDRPAQPRREPVDDGRGAICIARHRPRRSIPAYHRFVTARESPATGHMAIASIPTGGPAQHHPA